MCDLRGFALALASAVVAQQELLLALLRTGFESALRTEAAGEARFEGIEMLLLALDHFVEFQTELLAVQGFLEDRGAEAVSCDGEQAIFVVLDELDRMASRSLGICWADPAEVAAFMTELRDILKGPVGDSVWDLRGKLPAVVVGEVFLRAKGLLRDTLTTCISTTN